MLQLLFDLGLAPGEKLVDRLLWLSSRQAGDHLSKCLDHIGSGSRCTVLKDELQDEIKEGIREMKANGVHEVLQGSKDALLLFTTSRILLASFFRQILKDSEDSSEK